MHLYKKTNDTALKKHKWISEECFLWGGERSIIALIKTMFYSIVDSLFIPATPKWKEKRISYCYFYFVPRAGFKIK